MFFLGIIDNCVRSPDFNVEIECDLDFEDERQHYKLTIEDIKEMQDEDDGQDEASPEAESSQTETELSSQSSYFSSPNRTQQQFVPFHYKKQAVEYWKSGTRRNLSSNVKSKFKKLKNREMLYRWNRQVTMKGQK